MEIELSEHTSERAKERGTNDDEIKDVILTGSYFPAKGERKGKEKIFSYNNEWNGKIFPEKLVRVIFVIREKNISTVTVIVQFGKWTKTEQL